MNKQNLRPDWQLNDSFEGEMVKRIRRPPIQIFVSERIVSRSSCHFPETRHRRSKNKFSNWRTLWPLLYFLSVENMFQSSTNSVDNHELEKCNNNISSTCRVRQCQSEKDGWHLILDFCFCCNFLLGKHFPYHCAANDLFIRCYFGLLYKMWERCHLLFVFSFCWKATDRRLKEVRQWLRSIEI